MPNFILRRTTLPSRGIVYDSVGHIHPGWRVRTTISRLCTAPRFSNPKTSMEAARVCGSAARPLPGSSIPSARRGKPSKRVMGGQRAGAMA